MTSPTLGSLLFEFFEDHLIAQKGMRPATIKSYRDAVRLFLAFAAKDLHCALTRVQLADLTEARVGRFLQTLEDDRHNHIRSRNQRLVALKALFNFAASRAPEQWAQAERIRAIPMKRVQPPQTVFLDRDEIEMVFASLPTSGTLALRDQTLLLFLYNTGARVQEVADLRMGNLELDKRRVHLHGKGDKWRVCPLWSETVDLLSQLLDKRVDLPAEYPIFMSQRREPLTRFGIYKIVRHHTRHITKLVVRSVKMITNYATSRSNFFQRKTTGVSFISAIPLRMRSLSSAIDETRIWRRKVRAISENAHSIRLSQDPCLGV